MKISVLLPTRNRLTYLRYAIESVRRQRDDDWEIVVSDNCSEDDVGGYVDSLGDTRIRCVRTPRFVPVTANWNNALEHSVGDYVIMLGDDDALAPGYFRRIRDLIDRFEHPDFIYGKAYHYAYPGVMPGEPDGYLQDPPDFPVFGSMDQPFILSHDRAVAIARDALEFRMAISYNMQYSTLRRDFIERLRRDGAFFHSPYPDFYATNAMLLEAARIVVCPQPLAVIGITPKSFGFFFFNNRETEGVGFLKNLGDDAVDVRARRGILPGPANNTCWYLAMVDLERHVASRHRLHVNHGRYRRLQILRTFGHHYILGQVGPDQMRELKLKMSVAERLTLGILLPPAFAALRAVPAALRERLVAVALSLTGQAPGVERAFRQHKRRGVANILEAVESLQHPGTGER